MRIRMKPGLCLVTRCEWATKYVMMAPLTNEVTVEIFRDLLRQYFTDAEIKQIEDEALRKYAET